MSNQELCLKRLLETKESRDQLLLTTCTLDTVAFDWVKSRMKDEATLEEKYKHVLDHTIDYEAYIEAKTDLDKATRDYNDNPNSDTVRISLSYAESDWKQQKGSGPKIEENGKRAEDFILKEFRRYFDHKEGKFLNALFSKLDKSGDLTLSTEELSDLVHHEDLKGASIEEDGILLAFHDVLFSSNGSIEIMMASWTSLNLSTLAKHICIQTCSKDSDVLYGTRCTMTKNHFTSGHMMSRRKKHFSVMCTSRNVIERRQSPSIHVLCRGHIQRPDASGWLVMMSCTTLRHI